MYTFILENVFFRLRNEDYIIDIVHRNKRSRR